MTGRLPAHRLGSAGDPPPADLGADDIRAALSGARLTGPVVVRGRVASTMDDLAALADAGAPEGTVVVADVQSAGRGRLDRRWDAPPGAAVLLSVLLRPARHGLPAARFPELLMAAALGVADVVARHASPAVAVALKWPNDVVADGAKVAGLLAEVRHRRGGGPDAGPAVLVGIGLNVFQAADALPPGAVSLAQLPGVITSGAGGAPGGHAGPGRAGLIAEVLNAIDRHYADGVAGTSLVPRWAARLATVGQDVAVRQGDAHVRGRAVGVSAAGALEVETAAGERVFVTAGDVLPGGA
ncbi:biotin--[acetyl-CoA-carboxylase] ligase [bacterium]|nr:MAG: biotin--[acetyl-CoA-carboxylase] ligase [bacterium]